MYVPATTQRDLDTKLYMNNNDRKLMIKTNSVEYKLPCVFMREAG